MIRSVKFAVAGVIAAFAAVFVAAVPASAAPACPAGYSMFIVHYNASYERGAACNWPAVDDFHFQDTRGDGASVNFSRPNNALSGNVSSSDSNGANNGWVNVFHTYPNGQQIIATLCAFDYSASVSYGCSGSYYNS